jgi:predicted nucleic acid-binding protein
MASTALLLEYRDVLSRDEQLARFWASPREVDIVVGMLAAHLQPVDIHFRWRPQLSDPNDEMVLECAINGGAEAIVTLNVRDFDPGAARFGIDVLRPGVVVRTLELPKD